MATSELDSEVEFKRRALQLGVTQANIEAVVAAGFKTFGQYAFSVPYQPGSADESPLVDLLTTCLTREPDAGQLSCLRRLFWESHGLAVRDLRLRQEHGAEAVMKKLPTSERVARSEAQRKRLNGLSWSPDTEPSHQLVDRFVTMVEEQTVNYVRPELCTSRAQETLQVKQAKTFSLGSDGQLRVANKGEDLECSTAGEWKLRMALQRKALAMDLANLASFQVTEAWHTYLFTVREREVPKHMRPVTLQQILDADKRLWVLLAEEVRGKIVTRPGADPICDSIIERLRASNDVLSYLAPQLKFVCLPPLGGSLTLLKEKGGARGSQSPSSRPPNRPLQLRACQMVPTASPGMGSPCASCTIAGSVGLRRRPASDAPRAFIFVGFASRSTRDASAPTGAADL